MNENTYLETLDTSTPVTKMKVRNYGFGQPQQSAAGWATTLLSVALVSMSILVLEIAFTRIFSVIFEFHYAFLVISLAILGLGVGGIYVHTWVGKISNPNPKPIQILLPNASGLMALSILGMTILIAKTSIFHQILLAALLAFAPFFFGGIFLAAVFRLFPDKSPQIYAADLIGASVGSLLSLFLLKLGGINVNLLLVVIAFFPTVLLSYRKSAGKLRVMALLLLMAGPTLIFLLNYFYGSLGPIPFARGAHKEMGHLLASPGGKAKVIESRWSAFGRTDLVADEEDPDEMIFFVDGGAGAGMHRFGGVLTQLDKVRLNSFSGFFPLKLLPEREKEKVLIIGAGGGREVLVSLLGGAKEITAVEVNRDIVDLMKKYSHFNGGVYNGFPGVKVAVEEGRNFVRSTREKYDIIMLSLPITKTSRSPEGFSLTENFLFTVESINDYLDRLKSHGRVIVVAHDDMEIFRLILTSLSALKKRGMSLASARNHFYSVGLEGSPLFVLKKTPLTPQEAQSVHQGMHEYSYSSFSSFIPFIDQEVHKIPLIEGIYFEHYMLSQALILMLKGGLSQAEIVKMANFDLETVTDDNPFFYKFNIGWPPVIIFLLVFSSIAILGGWFVRAGHNQSEPGRNKIPFLLLFSFLGIGFMLIEISLFQKFILFLGQPVYSMAMLLFSILIGAGIGSWISGILGERRTLLKLQLAAMMAGLIVMTYTLILRQVFEVFLGTPFLSRIFVAFFLLMPLGFFLGMPFPLGMKLLDELGLERHVPRMWGVNGLSSVFGSALAIALAISLGFSYSMIIGALLYFFIFILFSAVQPHAKFESSAERSALIS